MGFVEFLEFFLHLGFLGAAMEVRMVLAGEAPEGFLNIVG